ncbi:MAG: GNAT family N-acetyltransferase [Phormidesmis sp.]
MNIRLAHESDLPELAALFRQTVLSNAPEHYTQTQTEVWASFASDVDYFHQFVLKVNTLVAVDDTGILGFAGISEEGHVASAYVRCDRLHQGIGSSLMHAILTYAQNQQIKRLHAEASKFSLGLFQKFGFRLYDTELVKRQGVTFHRYLVERYFSSV